MTWSLKTKNIKLAFMSMYNKYKQYVSHFMFVMSLSMADVTSVAAKLSEEQCLTPGCTPISNDDRIHINLVEMRLTPAININWQCVYSQLKYKKEIFFKPVTQITHEGGWIHFSHTVASSTPYTWTVQTWRV